MKLSLHAVGRSEDVFPFVALGAVVHEVGSLEDAKKELRALAKSGHVLVVLNEEFARAAGEAGGNLVVVIAGAGEGARTALEQTRELIARSVGVDLIARSGKEERKND